MQGLSLAEFRGECAQVAGVLHAEKARAVVVPRFVAAMDLHQALAAEASSIPFRRVKDLGDAISIKKGSPKKGGKEMDYLSRPSYRYKPQRGGGSTIPRKLFPSQKLDTPLFSCYTASKGISRQYAFRTEETGTWAVFSKYLAKCF